jgi:Fe-S-cluster-containing dehydrogenase component
MVACPNEAIRRTSKGVVIVNSKKCTGSGECVQACPYYAIRIHPDSGKAIKCIQCGACVDRCPVNAIWITTESELNEKDSDGRLESYYEKYESELYNKEEI